MRQSTPKVSVLMSVYNAERYVREAVESILSQTFGDFEFIVINDGSTDGTREVLEGIRDDRVRLLHQENVGLTRSLNRGLRLARGEYIARMDADDISLPQRFEREVALLDGDPQISLADTAARRLRDDGERVLCPTAAFAEPRVSLMLENPVHHGNVMVRREALLAVGGYDEHFRYAQDHDLWLRMAWRGMRFGLVPEALFVFRQVPECLTRTRRNEQWAFSREARLRVMRAVRSGAYALPPTLVEDYSAALLRLARRWLKLGFDRDAREAARCYMHLRPHDPEALTIVLRSHRGIRRWYDRAAALKARLAGDTKKKD